MRSPKESNEKEKQAVAAWNELTDEQRDVYLTFENNLRAAQGVFQRLCNTFETLNTTYNAQILGILADLDDNTVVPTTSGLAGASSLDSDAEMVSLVAHLQGVLTSYNTTGHKNLRDKAAGIANTLGNA